MLTMDMLLMNGSNGGLRNLNRDIDMTADIGDADVVVHEDGDVIGGLAEPNENNFEVNNIGVDEWMRQLQQQQEGLMGHGESSPNPPLLHQFPLHYEQNTGLSIPSATKNDNFNSSQTEIEVPQQGTDQMNFQDSLHLVTQEQSIDGFQQLQNIDNMTALNNILQQQQQQQQQLPTLLNNTIHATDDSLGTVQTLEQQVATLQQQQTQNAMQQMTTPNLRDSLLQLQKLQEQQQQILKNISHTGLVNPNSLVNPLEALLNTLMGQMGNSSNSNSSVNNDTGDNNVSNNNGSINNATNPSRNNSGALAWDQIGALQDLQPTNSPLQNSGGLLPSAQPHSQQQPQQVGFMETNYTSLESPHGEQLQLQQHTGYEPRSRPVPNNRLNTTKVRHTSNGNRNSNSMNIKFLTNNPQPLIRKTENAKKQKPKSFPSQLWDAMMTEGPSNDNAFEWLPDGKSFVVVDSDFFCKEILDRKFKQSKYGSFVRKLHRWGFIRLTSGTGTDCFHHPLFQRSKPELVTQIKCNSRNGKDGKKGHNAYARGEFHDNVQPSLMGVEKFIRAKVVQTLTDDALA